MTLAHATAEELRALLNEWQPSQFGTATDAFVYVGNKRYNGADVARIFAALPALLDRLERAEKVSKAAQEVAEYAICSVYDPSIGYVSHVPAVYVRGLQATLAALEGES